MIYIIMGGPYPPTYLPIYLPIYIPTYGPIYWSIPFSIYKSITCLITNIHTYMVCKQRYTYLWYNKSTTSNYIMYTCIYIYNKYHPSNTYHINLHIYIYMSRDPHTPPTQPDGSPCPVAGEGGFSQQPSHGVCSLYSAYSAYVSILRMDILYVI